MRLRFDTSVATDASKRRLLTCGSHIDRLAQMHGSMLRWRIDACKGSLSRGDRPPFSWGKDQAPNVSYCRLEFSKRSANPYLRGPRKGLVLKRARKCWPSPGLRGPYLFDQKTYGGNASLRQRLVWESSAGQSPTQAKIPCKLQPDHVARWRSTHLSSLSTRPLSATAEGLLSLAGAELGGGRSATTQVGLSHGTL